MSVLATEIVMFFESLAKLIKVALRKRPSKPERSLFCEIFGNNKAEAVTLGTDFLLTVNKRQPITLPALEDGNYSFSWRAMSEDGHVIKRKLQL